ncbi:MAG: hypothetical protein ACRDGU_09265 [Actinomycetota bacterium]
MTDGWRYIPDPSRWPARVAAYVTMARARLASPGALLHFDELFQQVLVEDGLGPDAQSLWRELGDERLRVAEAEYLVIEAFSRLVADGEALAIGGRGPVYVGDLWEALGFQEPRSNWENTPSVLRSTVRAQEREPAEWAELGTWPGVDALVREARVAYGHGLYVAAAATARVAAEQAVETALDTQGLSTDGVAAVREERLFGSLKASSFATGPLDYSATRSNLSAVRNQGNVAAHDGVVNHASLQEALTQLLPQAFVSLYRAMTRQT